MKQFLTLTILTVFMSVPLCVHAEDDRTRDLQKQMDKQQDEIRQMKQELDAIKGEHTSSQEQYRYLSEQIKERVKIDLYGTLAFEDFEKSHSSFEARNIELLLDARAGSRFRLFSEIDTEGLGAAESDEEHRVEMELEQGWIEYGINHYINPRFGVVLVPFGRYNLEHFSPYQDLTNKPVMAEHVVPTTWSEAGAGFTGSIYFGELSTAAWCQDFALTYEAYAVNGLTNKIDATSDRDAEGSFGDDNNNNKALAGRLQISPIPALQLGLSGYMGKYDPQGDRKIQAYDIDTKIVYGPAELVGEFANFDLDEGLNDEDIPVPRRLQGGYIEGRYHFWPAFLNQTFMGRGLESPTFTAVVRAGYAKIENEVDADWENNWEKNLTVGFNYRPVESLVFKIEYQFDHKNKDGETITWGNNNGFTASISAAF